MSKILFLGYTPPPFCPNVKIEAAHYRTWQFLQPLLEDDHQISFGIISIGNSDLPQNDLKSISNKLSWHHIDHNKVGWIKILQNIYDQFSPDCVVAVNFFPSLIASKLKTSKPLWFDIYGDYLTQIQASCFRNGSDRGLRTSQEFVKEILGKGDKFSACSTYQKHMLVGELAMVGRLNSESFGYNFVDVVAPGMIPPEMRNKDTREIMRTKLGISQTEKIVLWCGGYNTWTDIETLYGSLAMAMEKDPHIHLVSVGASTYQASDNVYDRFIRLVETSPFRPNFHLLGWQPWSEIPNFILASDVGLNIDALHYETIFGTRTRLLEMLTYDLPVITSLGSEISYFLVERGGALGFNIGDKVTLSNQILSIMEEDVLRRKIIAAAQMIGTQHLSFSKTTASVQDWVKNPTRSPDRQLPKRKVKEDILINSRFVVRRMLWNLFGLSQ